MGTILYEFELANKHLLKNWRGSVIAMTTLAIGVSSFMTLVAVLHVLDGRSAVQNPQSTFRVQMNPHSFAPSPSNPRRPDDVSLADAMRLFHEGPSRSTALMARSAAKVSGPERSLINAGVRYTTKSFFDLFAPPMRYGRSWGSAEDNDQVPVAVISERLNRRLFLGADSTGKRLSVNGTPFTIIGVLGYWRPTPKYFDLSNGPFAAPEDVIIPFSVGVSLSLPASSSMDCWSGSGTTTDYQTPSCTWVQIWVELVGKRDHDAYVSYLERFAREDGRIGAESNASWALTNVMDWLEAKRSLPNGIRLLAAISFGFLALCIISTCAYFLSSFVARTREVAIRRALGSRSIAIHRQFAMESLLTGILGGLLGLVLLTAIMHALRNSPLPYAKALELDFTLLCLALSVAALSGTIAGLFPSWVMGRVQPAKYLTVQ